MDDAPACAPRRVIVNADDMGMRAAWDTEIAAAVERGVVTSVSVSTSGATYPRARGTLATMGVDVGVHLDLVSGRPRSAPRDVPSLVDARGTFPGRWPHVVARYLARALSLREVELEWGRQVQCAFEDGLAPTHLDGHYHLHALPGLFEIATRIAARHGIRHVRIPSEPPRGVKAALLWALGRRARGQAPVPIVHCRGIDRAGHLGLHEWRAILGSLPAGVTEIVCHPGQSAREDAALRSSTLRKELSARARLVSFRALVPHRGAELVRA